MNVCRYIYVCVCARNTCMLVKICTLINAYPFYTHTHTHTHTYIYIYIYIYIYMNYWLNIFANDERGWKVWNSGNDSLFQGSNHSATFRKILFAYSIFYRPDSCEWDRYWLHSKHWQLCCTCLNTSIHRFVM